MTGEITITRVYDAPRERVWHALNDPETLKASVPGCESLERVDGETAFDQRIGRATGAPIVA